MKKNRKKIIFFLPSFKPGGASYGILKLCEYLKTKQFNLFVICVGKCELNKELIKNKVKILEMNVKSTFFSINQLKKSVSKIANSGNGKTIFVSNHHYANVISMIALKDFVNIKKILIERTSLDQLRRSYNFYDFIKKRIILFLIKIYYKKADKIIANSARESKDVSQFCGCKTSFVYPGAFKKISYKKINKLGNKINLITVGSLIKEKGYDTIIKSIYLSKNKNLKLKIFGVGYDKKQDEKSNLESLIKKYELTNQVRLLGFKSDLKKYYCTSHLYINSSHCEGFSSAIVEAMNFNIPVVCSDCKGGNREIVKSGKAGTLFKVDDYNQLKTIINDFLKNHKKYVKKAVIAKRHIKKFERKNNLKKYEKIFKKI